MLIPFALPPGIVSDDTSFATAGRWEDGSNVRPWRGTMQVIGGWNIAFGGVAGKCRGLLGWTDNGGSRLVALGTHSHLQIYAGGAVADITPSGLLAGAEDGIPGPGWGAGAYGDEDYGTPRSDYFARTWSLSTYGESLMACPRGQTIFWWQNDPGDPAAALVNAPEQVTTMLVTPERQVLAFGCNEVVSEEWNPLCIRGSDIEDPEGWTPSDANNAFEDILEGGGRIVAARLFGPYVAVWTDNGVYLGQFLGQLGQTYRWDRIAENHGLIAPNAVAVLGQTAYWIGPDFQFRAWSIGGAPEIIPCPIRQDFVDNLAAAQSDKIFASSLTQYNEIWFFYADGRDGTENSRYVALNVADGSWFRGRLARTAYCDAGVTGYPLGISPDGEAFYHELGRSANGANLDWFIKSADQYLEEAGRHMMVRGVRPDFEDQEGAIALTLYFRKYPQAAAIEKGPYVLADGAGKKDFRASGCVAAIRFSGASNPSFMRIGKPVFDAVATGER